MSILLGNLTFLVDVLSSRKVCEFCLALDYVYLFMVTLNYVQKGVLSVTNKGVDEPSTDSSVTLLPLGGSDIKCFRPYRLLFLREP
jgi:hypothetical protein